MSVSEQRDRYRLRRERTRAEILSAAEQFLSERPYRELSVEALMANTGLTRTNFYRHFDDLPDLMVRLLDEVGRELGVIAERWIGEAGDYPVAGKRALGDVVDFYARRGRLVHAIADASIADPRVERVYRQRIDTFATFIARGLDRLIQRGLLADLDTDELGRAVAVMSERYLLDAFGGDRTIDPRTVLATLEALFFGLVRAPSSET